MKSWITKGTRVPGFPTIHVVSDSLGKTGSDIARAICALYGNRDPKIEVFSEVDDAVELIVALQEHLDYHREQFGSKKFVLFYTLVARDVRAAIKKFIADNPEVQAVDLVEEPINALRAATGREPTPQPGAFRVVDDIYFRRIEAIEFTIAHDDGNRPQELTQADIVLLGVSRSSKTPLSIYLSQQGYKVANIPLDPQSEPPKEIYDIDTRRMFGLMTSPEVLVDIRRRRLAKAAAGSNVAASYADYENVCRDLEKSRELMRRLGCIVIRTDGKAIEESAQEILRYYTAFMG